MSLRTDQANLILTINNAQSAKTLQEMEQRARDLRRLLAKIPVDSAEFKTASAELGKINAKIKDLKTGMSGLRSEVTGFGKIWQNALSFAGGLGIFDLLKSGISNLVNYGRQALAEADAQLAADAQIKSAIQSTAGVAGRSLSDLKKQAEELQKVTLFGDDQTEGAQALLLTFANIRGEIFDNTIPIIQDMSTALKQDLSSSSIQVGKALNDPIKGITALTRVGVTFSAEQKKLIADFVKTGDVASAQTVILKELQKEFGGSARAAFEAANPIAQLKNVFGEIKEAAGSLLIGGLKQLAPLVRSVAASFLEMVSVPVSETLEKERQSFNGVSLQIQNLNVGSETRTKLINGLIRQYPQYLKGIDAEKVTNEQLQPILDKINKSYIVRIALQKQQEKIQPLLEREAEFANELAEKRANYNIQLARGAELAGVNLANISGESAQIDAVTKALEERVRAQGANFSLSASKEAVLLQLIRGGLASINQSSDIQVVAANRASEAEKQRLAVVEQLKKTYGDLVDEAQNFSGAADATGSAEGSPLGKTKAEAEAAAGSLAFLRKQIAEVQKEIEATPGESKALEPLILQLKVAEAALKALEERINRLKNPTVEAPPSAEEIAAQLGTDSSRPQTPGATDADRLAILEFNSFVLEESKLTAEELATFQLSLSKKKSAEELEQEKKDQKEKRSQFKDAALSSASSVASALVQIKQNALQEETDAAISALDAEFAAKRKGAEGNEQALDRINKQYEARKAAIEKKAAQERKRIALLEAIIAAALAVVKALPNPFTATAAGIAGAAQVAVIARSNFAGGGYTGQGNGLAPDSTGHRPVGVVHANEWVSPPWMTQHPVWGSQVAALEMVRRRGFADGGFTTTPTVGVTPLGGSAASAAEVSMEAYAMLAAEFRGFRAEVSAWQSKLRVSYSDIERVGSDLSAVRAEAGI